MGESVLLVTLLIGSVRVDTKKKKRKTKIFSQKDPRRWRVSDSTVTWIHQLLVAFFSQSYPIGVQSTKQRPFNLIYIHTTATNDYYSWQMIYNLNSKKIKRSIKFGNAIIARKETTSLRNQLRKPVDTNLEPPKTIFNDTISSTWRLSKDVIISNRTDTTRVW